MDRDQVRETIKYCLEHGDMGGNECDRDKCPNKDCQTGCAVTPLQEAVHILTPIEPVEYHVGDHVYWQCGACFHDVWIQHEYCPHCGRQVLWGD